MTDLAIRVQNLGKLYRIGGPQARYRTFREALVDGLSSPFRRIGRLFNPQSAIRNPQSEETIWALKNVSFDVAPGEVVGIIGPNGAGKSTLLKILSRITEPTEGRVEIHGRVSSLLEVGTGFHAELTGRENIFLNGAILGMSKAEIKRKFDEIVAFAEIEKFMDTPVKYYSSGMYVRLAFAVAAHLEPEILLVDEVLAVGDAAFQKKCLGKMGDVTKEGRTVLFVSHNMAAILRLCRRTILLEEGKVGVDGPSASAVDAYLGGAVGQDVVLDLGGIPRGGGLEGRARLVSVTLLSDDKAGPWKLPFGSDIVLEIRVRVSEQLSALELGIAVSTVTGFEIIGSLSSHRLPSVPFGPGEYTFRTRFPGLILAPGTYRFGLGLRANDEIRSVEDSLSEAFHLEVIVSELAAKYKMDTIQSVIIPKVDFEVAGLNKS